MLRSSPTWSDRIARSHNLSRSSVRSRLSSRFGKFRDRQNLRPCSRPTTRSHLNCQTSFPSWRHAYWVPSVRASDRHGACPTSLFRPASRKSPRTSSPTHVGSSFFCRVADLSHSSPVKCLYPHTDNRIVEHEPETIWNVHFKKHGNCNSRRRLLLVCGDRFR